MYLTSTNDNISISTSTIKNGLIAKSSKDIIVNNSKFATEDTTSLTELNAQNDIKLNNSTTYKNNLFNGKTIFKANNIDLGIEKGYSTQEFRNETTFKALDKIDIQYKPHFYENVILEAPNINLAYLIADKVASLNANNIILSGSQVFNGTTTFKALDTIDIQTRPSFYNNTTLEAPTIKLGSLYTYGTTSINANNITTNGTQRFHGQTTLKALNTIDMTNFPYFYEDVILDAPIIKLNKLLAYKNVEINNLNELKLSDSNTLGKVSGYTKQNLTINANKNTDLDAISQFVSSCMTIKGNTTINVIEPTPIVIEPTPIATVIEEENTRTVKNTNDADILANYDTVLEVQTQNPPNPDIENAIILKALASEEIEDVETYKDEFLKVSVYEDKQGNLYTTDTFKGE